MDAFTPAQVNVSDVTVEKGAPCAGKKMGEIPWPHDSLIASLRRGSQVFIPHGETVIKPGDVLVVVVEGEARKEILRLCRQPDDR